MENQLLESSPNQNSLEKPLTCVPTSKGMVVKILMRANTARENNFTLLGADEWIKGFKFICHIECFDGQHPNVFSPKEEIPHDEFTSIEDINNYLLQHPEVQAYLNKRKKGDNIGKAMFLMFDEKTMMLAVNITQVVDISK